jgi:hypothetical protein
MNTKKPGGRPTPRRTPKASDDGFFISGFWIFKRGAGKKISTVNGRFPIGQFPLQANLKGQRRLDASVDNSMRLLRSAVHLRSAGGYRQSAPERDPERRSDNACAANSRADGTEYREATHDEASRREDFVIGTQHRGAQPADPLDKMGFAVNRMDLFLLLTASIGVVARLLSQLVSLTRSCHRGHVGTRSHFPCLKCYN